MRSNLNYKKSKEGKEFFPSSRNKLKKKKF